MSAFIDENSSQLLRDIVGNFSTYAKAISAAVPPNIPESVIAFVATTPYGLSNPNWAKFDEVPQMITALVLIQESPAGRTWDVKLADIPRGTQPSDHRFRQECSKPTRVEMQACVEWFFKKSGLTETSPLATVQWSDKDVASGEYGGITFSCNAILRMLHAAQEQFPFRTLDKDIGSDLVVLQKTISELQSEVAILKAQLFLVSKRAPAITCLMHLFAGHYSSPMCSTCTSESTAPTFSIAPHTDRLSDLGVDAQRWLLQQLDTRNLWIRVTDVDSYDNHISWTKFEGAVEMGISVVFSHGNYRFC